MIETIHSNWKGDTLRMKINKKFMIGITLITLMIASFLAGSYMTEQKNRQSRLQRCSTLITFAIDKAETGDLADQDTMKALISNVYAAYQFCDNAKSANQLHDLWNYLLLENDSFADAQDIVLHELTDILRSIKTDH